MFSVGIDEIDAQHRRLIEFVAAIIPGDTIGSGAVLDEMLKQAARHFASEEAFMARIGYPDLPEHAVEHKMLTQILAAYGRELESGKTDVEALKHFMFRWLIDHIVDDDRKIGEFFRGRDF